MDFGCTFHICPNRDWFADYEAKNGGVVLIGNDAQCHVVGVGSVQIKSHNGCIRTLTNVRHVSNVKRNLISLGTLESNGYKYTADRGVLKVSTGSCTILKANRVGSLYVLQGSTVTGSTAAVSSPLNDLDFTQLWHMCLGHMSEKGLKLLSSRGLLGDQGINKLEFCKHCVFGKQKRVSFSTGIHCTRGILDYIHSDLWGPSKVPSFIGKRYMMTLTDDFSRKMWVYFLKLKSEALATFKNWKALVENHTGRKSRL